MKKRIVTVQVWVGNWLTYNYDEFTAASEKVVGDRGSVKIIDYVLCGNVGRDTENWHIFGNRRLSVYGAHINFLNEL